MFPQPSGCVASLCIPLRLYISSCISRDIGAPELIIPLLSLSALSPLSSSSSSSTVLTPTEIEPFLNDLARRFGPDPNSATSPDDFSELEGILAPVVRSLLFHESLSRPEGLGGGDAGWRGVVSGLEALVGVKPIAEMIVGMEEWIPEGAGPQDFERLSLMGPLCKLGVFTREWVSLFESLLRQLIHSILACNCEHIFLRSRQEVEG